MNTHLQLSLKISILHILDINIGDNYNDEMNFLNGKWQDRYIPILKSYQY